jgi:hypothetical protein
MQGRCAKGDTAPGTQLHFISGLNMKEGTIYLAAWQNFDCRMEV